MLSEVKWCSGLQGKGRGGGVGSVCEYCHMCKVQFSLLSPSTVLNTMQVNVTVLQYVVVAKATESVEFHTAPSSTSCQALSPPQLSTMNHILLKSTHCILHAPGQRELWFLMELHTWWFQQHTSKWTLLCHGTSSRPESPVSSRGVQSLLTDAALVALRLNWEQSVVLLARAKHQQYRLNISTAGRGRLSENRIDSFKGVWLWTS